MKCKKKNCNIAKYCRGLCKLHYSRFYNDKNRNKTRISQRKYYHSHKDKINEKKKTKFKYENARIAAIKHGHSWNITRKFYLQLISKGCFYCGKDLKEYGISLDRINNNFGYNKNNVIPCCGRDNRLRSNIFSIEETKIMVKALEEFRSNRGK